MTKPRQPLRTAPVVCPRDAYPPTNISEKELNDRSRRTVELFGRLAPGVSVSAARAEFDAISRRLQIRLSRSQQKQGGVRRALFGARRRIARTVLDSFACILAQFPF